jgi:hypothetical protein
MEDEPQIVDLCKYLLPPAQNNPNFPAGSNYMFPCRFEGENSKILLVTELKIAAIKCGFSLIITTSRKKPSSITSERGMQVRLGCTSSIAFKEISESHGMENEVLNNHPLSEKLTYTKRAIDTEDTCSFAFVIFMQKDNAVLYPKRWFLAFRKGLDAILKCNYHAHHFKLDANLISVSTGLLSDEEKKLLKDCSQLYMTSSTTAMLLSQSFGEQTGLGWTTKQVYWLTYKER